MSSQFRRGGGMYCFFNEIFWEFMISAVGMTEDCPVKPVYNQETVKSLTFMSIKEKVSI